MTIPSNIRPFWDKFLDSVTYDASARFYEAFHFDDNEASADLLAELVLNGTKRATASLLWSFEAENEPLPQLGALSVVTNWAAEPLCVIEATSINVVPYNQVTADFAATEGEGDKSLRYWREAHWDFFSEECVRIGREPDLEMPVVCEKFKVIYPVTLLTQGQG